MKNIIIGMLSFVISASAQAITTISCDGLFISNDQTVEFKNKMQEVPENRDDIVNLFSSASDIYKLDMMRIINNKIYFSYTQKSKDPQEKYREALASVTVKAIDGAEVDFEFSNNTGVDASLSFSCTVNVTE